MGVDKRSLEQAHLPLPPNSYRMNLLMALSLLSCLVGGVVTAPSHNSYEPHVLQQRREIGFSAIFNLSKRSAEGEDAEPETEPEPESTDERRKRSPEDEDAEPETEPEPESTDERMKRSPEDEDAEPETEPEPESTEERRKRSPEDEDAET